MTDPHHDFDPWAAPLDELSTIAREIGTYAEAVSQDLSTIPARKEFAAHILDVLQARVVLEAARLQREAVEAQTETTRSLVRVTWWLAGATAVLAIAAIVALFLSGSA